ncbi:hypothetical protein [Yinghuangia seranimata]|uniref:hypothetical protein n=1 Tax=Yinghuangia seranimata TaxID=408067 RepID=UPI00248B83AC|nr:hypothetical protein [Yinghuangia seranimata]MDI2129336.1 hypothetical protein [Yinghuangia seranimata]
MRTMSKSEVAETARPYVDFVAEVFGPGAVPTWRGIEGAPALRGDGTYDAHVYAYTAGAQAMDVPVAAHIALITRLRDACADQGWSITRFTTREDTGTAALVCAEPDTEYELAVNSTTPPTAIAILVNTPPFAVPDDPEPEPPAPPQAPPPAPPAAGPGPDIRGILG